MKALGCKKTKRALRYFHLNVSVCNNVQNVSFGTALNNMGDTQHAIVCFWTDKNQIPGTAHYVAVTNNHDKLSTKRYKVYNYENKDTTSQYKDSLSEILDIGAIITGIIIN